jgi:hypothetical protein
MIQSSTLDYEFKEHESVEMLGMVPMYRALQQSLATDFPDVVPVDASSGMMLVIVERFVRCL